MTSLSQNADTVSYPMRMFIQPSTDIDSYYSYDSRTGKSALSVPDTRFSRVSVTTLIYIYIYDCAVCTNKEILVQYF